MIPEELLSQHFAHFLGFVIGLFTVFVIFLDLHVLNTIDWDVFTSRVFLKQEDTIHALTNMSTMLSLALLFLTTNHLIRLIRGHHPVADILTVLATASLTIGILSTHLFNREIGDVEQQEGEIQWLRNLIKKDASRE